MRDGVNERLFVIEMTVEDYARMVHHSVDYVKKYILHGRESDVVAVRILKTDLINDIYDVKGADR